MRKLNPILLAVIFSFIVLTVSCSPPPPVNPCDNPTGNMVCLGETQYLTNDNYWSTATPTQFYFVMQDNPFIEPVSLSYIAVAFNAFDDSAPIVPAVGIYPYSSDTIPGRYFNYYTGLTYSGSDILFLPDTTDENILTITASTDSTISGYANCHVYNSDVPSDKRGLKLSFENLHLH